MLCLCFPSSTAAILICPLDIYRWPVMFPLSPSKNTRFTQRVLGITRKSDTQITGYHSP